METKADKIYFDKINCKYLLHKDRLEPAERYITVYRGNEGIFIEHWLVDYDLMSGDEISVDNFLDHKHRLDIAFTVFEYKNHHSNEIRTIMEEENHCKLSMLLYWTIPSSMFDDCLKTAEKEKTCRCNFCENDTLADNGEEIYRSCKLDPKRRPFPYNFNNMDYEVPEWCPKENHK